MREAVRGNPQREARRLVEGSTVMLLNCLRGSREVREAGETMAPEGYPVYSPTEECHYFVCRLQHILTLSVLGVQEEPYTTDLHRRQTRFLSCLINHGDERLTYDLRYVSCPDTAIPSRGRVEVALLCRMDGVTSEEAQQYAHHLSNLLKAHLEEFGFELADRREVRSLLSPFPVNHFQVVMRRGGLARLDSLQSGRRSLPLGFTATAAPEAKSEVPADAIFHVFPYLPTSAAFTGLLKLLLLEPDPVAISVRLRPTRLTLSEEAFLEEQITRCERYAQVGLGAVSEDASSLQPAYREQAKAYQQYQARFLWGLRAGAALMTVEVASPKPIPAPIVHTLGGLVTQPAGGNRGGVEESPDRYLAGGFAVLPIEGEEVTRRIKGFEEVELLLPAHPLAPLGGERLVSLFDSVEAGAAFRLPPATVEAPPGITVRSWRSRPAPVNLPRKGLLLGMSVERGGVSHPIRIAPEDPRRHIYIVGQTGTGKTTLLQTMILDDMRSGKGLCVVDPHGDLFKELLGKVPEDRIKDVIVLDPTDAGRPVGLNLLEYETEAQRHFLVQELVGILARLLEDEYGAGCLAEFAGPMFFQHMRMNLLLAMSNPESPGTLLEFHAISQEKDYWRRWLPLKMRDPLLDRWVKHVLPKTDYTRPGSEGTSMGGYVGSKFEGFVFDPLLRYIFGQKSSTINLRAIMDQGKILLVNLAKGELTEANARFLGMVLLAKLMVAAMGRVAIPEGERREFILYVDEFQSLATQSFVTLLSEARKFGLSLVLANQFLSQVRDPRIVQAIFGNVATLVCFRLGQADAEILERQFSPVFTHFDLSNLPNWQAYMTTLIQGQTVRPFSLQTLPDPTPHDASRARTVRAWSRVRYGRPRQKVEEEIARSLGCGSEAEQEEQEEA